MERKKVRRFVDKRRKKLAQDLRGESMAFVAAACFMGPLQLKIQEEVE